MNCALLRPDPPQLAVGDEATPEAAHVADDPIQGATHDEGLERVSSSDAHLGAPTAREGQAVPLETVVCVGVENDVGGRVVRIGVHRVRPVEPPRGREANVPNRQADDAWEAAHLTIHPMFSASSRLLPPTICR